MSSAYTTVFFPIVPWILQIITIAFAITVGLMLISVGEQQFQVVGLTDKSACQCSGPAANYAVCSKLIFTESILFEHLLTFQSFPWFRTVAPANRTFSPSTAAPLAPTATPPAIA